MGTSLQYSLILRFTFRGSPPVRKKHPLASWNRKLSRKDTLIPSAAGLGPLVVVPGHDVCGKDFRSHLFRPELPFLGGFSGIFPGS